MNMINRAPRNFVALGTSFSVIILYLFAVVFSVTAIAKPIVPDNVSAWYGIHGRKAGLVAFPPAGSSDILGFWIIRIAIAFALSAHLVGTRLLRSVASKSLKSILRRTPIPDIVRGATKASPFLGISRPQGDGSPFAKVSAKCG